MKNSLASTLTTLVLASALVSTAAAHHSFSMFDRATQKVVSGTVVRWAFNNPHSWLYINVKNADGKETLWSFEGAAPPQLVGRGVLGSSFEPGKTVTVMYCPLLDGRTGGALGWVKVAADDKFILPGDGGCRVDDANIARWKDWLAKGITSNKDAQ